MTSVPQRTQLLIHGAAHLPTEAQCIDWCAALAMADPHAFSAWLSVPLSTAPLQAFATAVCDVRRGSSSRVREAFEPLVAHARGTGNGRLLAWSLAELGRGLGQQGSIARSADLLMESALLARRLEIPVLESLALANLGMAYGQEGVTRRYLRYTRQALEVARAAGDLHGEVHCLCNLAGGLCDDGKRNEALAHYERALAVAREVGLPTVEALVLAGLGFIRYDVNDAKAGRRLVAQSIALSLKAGDTFSAARSHLLEGAVYMRQGDGATAEVCAKASWQLAEKHQHSYIVLRAIALAAEAQAAQGDFSRAYHTLTNALSLDRYGAEAAAIDARRSEELALESVRRLEELQARVEELRELEQAGDHLREALEQERTERRALEALTTTDALTGARNRRAVHALMEPYLAEPPDTREARAILLVDLDHFKQINDQYGHDVGDDVLVHIVAVLTAQLRSDDLIARWGGEEFAIVLRAQAATLADQLAERTRAAIEATPLVREGRSYPCTASIGITDARADDTLLTLLKRADEALYAAKDSGRNRVVSNLLSAPS
jgi:diguanylate cyclase (GGDEF)-like protein